MNQSRNIAARAGRWSAQHRKTAILGWIAFVILAFVVGGKVGTNLLTDAQSGVGESGKASRIVADAYPDKVGEVVLVQSKSLKTGDPRFRAVVDDVTQRLDGVAGVTAISGPYDKAGAGAVSPDGHAALVQFEIPGDSEKDASRHREDREVGGRRRRRRARRTPASASSSPAAAAPRRSSRPSSTPTSRRPARRRSPSRS